MTKVAHVNHTDKKKVTLSVIVPITERYDPITGLFYEYKRGVESTGLEYEIIYVIDSGNLDALDELAHIQNTEELTIITLAKWFGESIALNAAFGEASGDILLTLPAYKQVEASEIPGLIKAIDDSDIVIARRWPRRDSILNRLQSSVFNFMLRSFSDLRIHDAGCSVRVFRRQVMEEVPLYGDLHRFFPIMAHRHGFKTVEVDVEQSKSDTFQRIYAPGIYLRRLLDLLTVFFLIKFTKKPLRFFGLVGSSIFGLGVLATIWLVSERLFFNVALADRPALILSSLLIVLGIQIIAIGLIGEIIIFTHAKDLKEYKIDRIIN
jgi:glycosyltransferase involved in cell wall biosynthesis